MTSCAFTVRLAVLATLFVTVSASAFANAGASKPTGLQNAAAVNVSNSVASPAVVPPNPFPQPKGNGSTMEMSPAVVPPNPFPQPKGSGSKMAA